MEKDESKRKEIDKSRIIKERESVLKVKEQRTNFPTQSEAKPSFGAQIL